MAWAYTASNKNNITLAKEFVGANGDLYRSIAFIGLILMRLHLRMHVSPATSPMKAFGHAQRASRPVAIRALKTRCRRRSILAREQASPLICRGPGRECHPGHSRGRTQCSPAAITHREVRPTFVCVLAGRRDDEGHEPPAAAALGQLVAAHRPLDGVLGAVRRRGHVCVICDVHEHLRPLGDSLLRARRG